ncbi:MAG TPA: extracellular solute-binding protein [Candidatus Limnocylindrales bacterium]|nr:extracellular solute-binding protein [Candidatus Limnocylindrales bacterium]
MNRRLTRLVTLGAAGLLAIGVAMPAAAQDKVSIDMIQSGYTDRMQPYFDDLAARFMEANLDIDVSVQVVSWNDIYDVINTRVASGDPPDIMNLNYFANFAADGLLYTAEEILPPEVLEDFVQTFRDNSKYEGVEYAVADLASDRLFFYNQDIFDAAGVEVPTTWSELLAACEAIKETQPGIIPIAIPLGPEEAQAEFLIWTGGNGGAYFRDGEWVINSAENLEALEFLQTLVDNGCTQPNPGTTDRSSGAWPLFAEGVAAMVSGSVFFPGELETTYESGVNYGVAPFPPNDGKESITLGVQDYFFGFKKEGNQEAIQKFLTFLFEPDNYAGFLGAAGGFLPATISAAETMSSDPGLAPFIEVLPTAIFYPSDQAAWPAVQAAIQQNLGTALSGTDKQQVLDQIQAAATEE